MRDGLSIIELLCFLALSGCTANRIAVDAKMHGGVAHALGTAVFIPVPSPDVDKTLSIVLPPGEEGKLSVDCVYSDGQRRELRLPFDSKSSRAAMCRAISDGNDPAGKIPVSGAELQLTPGVLPRAVDVAICIDQCDPESKERFLQLHVNVPQNTPPSMPEAPPPKAPPAKQTDEEKRAEEDRLALARERTCRLPAFSVSERKLETVTGDLLHVAVVRPLSNEEDVRVSMIRGDAELEPIVCLYDDGTQRTATPTTAGGNGAPVAAPAVAKGGAPAQEKAPDQAVQCTARFSGPASARLVGLALRSKVKTRKHGPFASGVLCAGVCQPWCPTTYSPFEFVAP